MLTTMLRGTTALICLSLAGTATAQEDPGFLGTLILTPGKRDLSFGTALSRTVIDEECIPCTKRMEKRLLGRLRVGSCIQNHLQ